MSESAATRPTDFPEEFDGCARECRIAGAHTHVWGRCAEAPEPTPPSKDDLRGLLIAAGLVSHVQTVDDGCDAVVVHSDEEAADRALAVFQQWMFGTPEEVAARKAEADARTPDDTVRLCEMARPGEHERRVREQVATDLKRAAAGRRDYATRAPDHIAAELEGEARVFDTAARVAADPRQVMWGLLPASMWTDADRPEDS